MRLQDYDLQDGEILSAVPRGFVPRDVMASSTELLSFRRLVKMVSSW